MNGVDEAIERRWTDTLASIGNSFLNGGKSQPFPKNESGFIDLRGLTICQFIKNAKLYQLDLSSSRTAGFGQFGFCTVTETNFTKAILGTNLGNEFIKCCFNRSNLAGAVLRGRFDDCDFTAARLTSVMANGVVFTRCKFVGSGFRKATLLHCTFEDCEFDRCSFGNGSVAGSRFIRSPIAIENLAKTVTENVCFSA
ncbi:MAG: pentapeptide repeat-containing protein [Pirellulaceae bacterium]